MSEFYNEPKISFANERTYLKWIHITVTLGGLGGILVGFADHADTMSTFFPPDYNSAVSLKTGGAMLLIAMVVGLYAMYTFWWRAKMIRERIDGSFYDSIGPYALGHTIMAALTLVLIFSVVEKRHTIY
jgi:uncharacterized membrane protein YidH (DUF202 family)